MVYNPVFTSNILESLGVLSTFNIAETIWEKYEEFAIPKIKESTLKIRGSLHYLKDITSSQAALELHTISSIIPALNKTRSLIESIEDNRFKEFKIVALDFLDHVDLLHNRLQDAADVHSSYEISQPVLASDWDSSIDDHWDNY